MVPRQDLNKLRKPETQNFCGYRYVRKTKTRSRQHSTVGGPAVGSSVVMVGGEKLTDKGHRALPTVVGWGGEKRNVQLKKKTNQSTALSMSGPWCV